MKKTAFIIFALALTGCDNPNLCPPWGTNPMCEDGDGGDETAGSGLPNLDGITNICDAVTAFAPGYTCTGIRRFGGYTWGLMPDPTDVGASIVYANDPWWPGVQTWQKTGNDPYTQAWLAAQHIYATLIDPLTVEGAGYVWVIGQGSCPNVAPWLEPGGSIPATHEMTAIGEWSGTNSLLCVWGFGAAPYWWSFQTAAGNGIRVGIYTDRQCPPPLAGGRRARAQGMVYGFWKKDEIDVYSPMESENWEACVVGGVVVTMPEGLDSGDGDGGG